MDVGLLFKIIGVGLLVAVAYQILSKSGREEMAMLLSLAGIVIVLALLIGKISDLLNQIRSLFGI